MKRFLLLFLLLSAVSEAQDFSSNWNGHFSYYGIKAIDVAGSNIYTAAKNSVFIYNLNNNQLQTFSSIDGLSGEEISAIHYSPSHQIMVIGYENGLIELKTNNQSEVLRVIDITQQATIPAPQKRINHFNEHNGILYISAGFGISEYDLSALEFGETFYIGDDGSQLGVNQTAVHNNILYAATQGGGIRYASLDNPNIINYIEWQVVGNPSWGWLGISNVGGNLFANIVNGMYRIEAENIISQQSLPSSIKDVWTDGDRLVLTGTTSAYLYNSDGNLVNSLQDLPSQELDLNTAGFIEGNFLLGDSKDGLIVYNSSSGAQDNVSPRGPLLNRIFNTAAEANELWVVFGEYSITYNPYPLNYRGVSHLEDDQWQNYQTDDLFGAAELSHVTINPNNPENVFISSYFSGLLEFQNDIPVKLYDESDGLDVVVNANDTDIRINGSAFDSQGNLWFVNSRVEEGLKVLTPSGEIQGVDLSSIITDPADSNVDLGFHNLVIDQNDNVYFGTSANGVVAYQTSTGVLRKMDISTGANLPWDDIRGLAVDQNNVLWIGTNRGLRVLYNPASVFTQNSVATTPIIILEGDVAQELLFEQFVSDIEVDGSNNKWLATATSGVFYVSSNGQDILAHFTKDNSPLPSNNVTTVSVDDQTGWVYFGTVNGLVSYKGSATEPRTNLENVYAYPNPVRPGFEGNVVIDGLMRNSNVKITDIEGNLVYEEVSQGGSIIWDTRAFGKHKVASGVYMVLVTSEDQAETKVSKIMVIR